MKYSANKSIAILLVEDNSTYSRLVQEMLNKYKHVDCRLEFVNSFSAAINRLSQGGIDVVLLDLTLPDSKGINTFYNLYNHFPEIPIIVMTNLPEEFALEAVRGGAQDYLIKGEFNGNLLVRSIQYAIERKRAEEELMIMNKELALKAKLLEDANSDLSQYAYVVSHDIKAPLRAIQNYTCFLMEDLAELVDGEQKTYLQYLGRAVQQAQKLVDDLLVFSRIGRNEHKFELMDLGKFIKELAESLNSSEQVNFEIADEWPTLEVEPTLFRQIFQNLIINAIKFNNKPEIDIQIGYQMADNKNVKVSVRDNGIGIEKENIDEIFRVFRRLHTSEEYEGTGIGLAIVKKAISILNGSIHVESELGKGSTFSVEIPVQQKK